jgi:hypothetical protein
MHFVRVDNYPFHTNQRAALDVHPGSDLETRPRLGRKAGTKDRPNGLDLVVVYRDGDFARTDNVDHAGCGEYRQEGMAYIEAAEQVTGEEREFQFFLSVGPLTARAIERKELFVALATQGRGGDDSLSGLDPKGIPPLV